jgi:hypothetical protein
VYEGSADEADDDDDDAPWRSLRGGPRLYFDSRVAGDGASSIDPYEYSDDDPDRGESGLL